MVDIEDCPHTDNSCAAGTGNKEVSGAGQKRVQNVTYNAPTRKIAVRVTFCRKVRARFQMGDSGRARITKSSMTFVIAVPRREAFVLMHLLC